MSMRLNDSRDSLQGSFSFDCFNIARTSREKKTFIIGGVLITTVVLGLIVAVIVLAINIGTRKEVTTTCNPPPVPTVPTVPSCPIRPQTHCNSADCTLQAAELVYNIDETVDPCEDFFKYACGRWFEEDIVRYPPFVEDSPLNKLQLKIYKRIRDILNDNSSNAQPAMKKAMIAYDACMNPDQAGMNATVWDIAKELGGWPMLEGAQWDHNLTTLEDVFTFLKKFREFSEMGALFTMIVNPDYMNSSRNVPMFLQPTPLYTAKPFARDDETIINEVWQTIRTLNPDADEDVVRNDTKAVLSLNDAIQDALVTADPLDMNYTSKSIEEFTSEMENVVNWVKYLNDIFANAKKTLHPTDPVGVSYLDYFKTLSGYLKNYTPKMGRAIINYEFLQILMDAKKNSFNVFNNQQRKHFQQLTNSIPKVDSPQKWFVCVYAVSEMFANVITPEYGRLYMDESATVTAGQEMTNYIVKSFREELQNLEWLDEDTRAKAIEKLDQITKNYDYPKWATDKTKVDEYYESLSVGPNSLNNSAEYSKFFTTKNYLRIHGDDSESRLSWIISPLSANAFYYAQENSINMLQGIMQPPIFGPDRLKVMNFGALGMIIAHEITHGFDTRGGQFDGHGNLKSWMSSKVFETFMNKAQCFIDQYSNYSLTSNDLPGYDGKPFKIDGKQTVAENIADGGGIRNAFKAYKKWEEEHGEEVLPEVFGKNFTHNQLFFLSFANAWCTKYSYGAPAVQVSLPYDTHSPAQIRIIGSLSNFEEFSTAFKCKPTASMVSSKPCVLW